MANHKSSKKRARQNDKRKLINKMKMTKTRTLIKKLRAAIDGKNKEEAVALLPKAQALYAGTNLKKNTISRKTSRLALQINKL